MTAWVRHEARAGAKPDSAVRSFGRLKAKSLDGVGRWRPWNPEGVG
ncbi:predicted protein [Streptomyces viridosporus ATCC 14672]|uniref:Predicted protein n=1 Tax=Streptomyces viridosporus (strain ATCC 14672 / DSM 40746 / JCM 4963 / KCTC 9882 / NRRL B-12104 / FH 1290) TaxID=566461 RepID=D6A8U1_STRV1|nr:predicted protein [Streptomyces viridosporus ATCC 14672]